jgi:hypothetical protein
MSQLQVPKTVALCFLEAAKVTLEHLGVRRLELPDQTSRVAADMTRLYTDVRRVRDYLQRCVSGFGDTVDLELVPEDVVVLVACCRRLFEAIDARLVEPGTRPDERQVLQNKQQVLGRWAVDLAQKPLVELPLRRLSLTTSEASRAFLSKLQTKVYGDVRDRKKILSPQAMASTPVDAPADGAGAADAAAPADGAAAAVPAVVAAPASEPPLFDHNRLLDPRLRALVGLDLRSYARAVAAQDLRMATVLLGAVLEAALIDHVLPRRHAFEVSGDPIGWNLQGLLLAALAEQAQPTDKALAQHLFTARNLLRPSVQVLSPTIVTPASFETLRSFAQRSLHALGYGAPPELPAAVDLLQAVAKPA